MGKKFRDNVAAIRLLKTLEAEGRPATPEERKTLAKYVGWGAMKAPFDPHNKAWAKQHAELKGLLTEEEFRAARASTLDAHYTSPVAVGAMYQALERLGFKGGRVLEPSVGIGNFFGLMPPALRKASQLHGVELDSLTSRMVAALYPKARIAKATGFQDFEIPSEYFDVVIGNPPFGSHPLVDKNRSAYSGFSIHNYFLAKSIDKLRPGGVMAVVVSHNFLDAQDGRSRKWIGERASLIGGARLPNTAFKENAGTEVVTDILIFQKHGPNGESASIAPWQNVVEQVNVNPKTGESAAHKVNQFFVENPQCVLGTPSAGGSMYRANEYTIEADGDIKEGLAEWVRGLPENIYSGVERAAVAAATDMAVPDGVKVGSYFVGPDGNVMRRGDDIMGEKTAHAWEPRYESQIGRMTGMIAIRDALRQQMRLERSPDATEREIEANRAKLSRLYDDFLKKYKHLNSTTNRGIFMDDTEAHLIQALEFDYDKGIGKAAAEKEGIELREPKAKKADIFSRRVAFPPQDFITVTTAKDALLASLNYRGKIDAGYMEEVYGKPMAEIVEELGDVVFDDPQAGLVPADEYLSGDVKAKLDEARAAAREDAKYRRNVEALEKVIPKDKTPSEISVSIGAAFVPAEVYEQFVRHISGGGATLRYLGATGQWLVAYQGDSDAALNTGRFGTSELSAQDLFGLLLLGRGAVVKRTYRSPDGSTTTEVLEKETEAAREKQSAIQAEWRKWLWQDPERADRIAAIYNEKMNRIVGRAFDGSHMTFPGMNPALSLLAHQKNGVWRGLQSYQVLYDHVVGAGKTFAMATLAMEMRRLGVARKPLFVVPNYLTLQWRSEFTRLYPGSNILAATPEDFSKDNRERLFSKIITGDWDAVVIGHSSLKKIGLPPHTEAAILQEQIEALAGAIEEMKRERGDKRIVSDMEKIRKNLEAKMADRLAAVGERSKVVSFDELGVDAMFVDEMHEFKNLVYHTTMDRNPGMGNPAGSAKAFDMFVKARWLFDTFGEKTPFVTATGTPVSNSLVEMFNMQRYMQYPTLARHGLEVFDAWARQFGSVESVYEVAPSGAGYRQSTRFAKFSNLPALMGLYNSFADTITLDDLKAQEEAQGKRFPVPKMVGGRPTLIVAKRSPAVAALMGVPKAQTGEAGNILFGVDLDGKIEIARDEKSGKWYAKISGEGGNAFFGGIETEQDARLKLVEQALAPVVSVDEQSILGRFGRLRELTKATEGKVNALSLTGEANKAGLDFRLINPAAPDFPGSKINLAVDNMMRIYRQWDADKGAQLMFCDLSIPLSARASYSNKARRLYVRDEAGGVAMKRGTLHALPGHEDLPYFVVQRGEKDSKRFDLYDAAAGLRLQSDFRSKQDAVDVASELLRDDAKRQRWIGAREAAGEIEQGEIDEYNNEHDIEVEDLSLFFTREDIAGTSGAAKFSVYDDIKAKLVAKGVPEREIAFIHDYSTPQSKDKLFKAVNAGEVRFLLGSTPKMGAGTNVQKRLVGLHHIDAPWRPSDLEQREGRIIRRGNELYERDPEGFEVFIGRYATEQTYDTRRWQILEHKARGIEQLRNFDGSINEIEDLAGEAANAADMKAAASGDPLILEETRLRNDVRRLEQLQSAHADEVLAMTRKARSAQEYADTHGPSALADIEALLAEVKKYLPDKNGFAPLAVNGGRPKTDKAAVNKALETAFASVRDHLVGKAEVKYRGLRFALEHDSPSIVLLRSPTGVIGSWGGRDLFSPSGMVQRLKNYIERLPATADDARARIAKAGQDARAMREQAKAPFAQADELERLREAHQKVRRALMAKGPEVPPEQKDAVAEATERQKERLRALGFGDAVDEFFGDGGEAALSFRHGERPEPLARLTGDEIRDDGRGLFEAARAYFKERLQGRSVHRAEIGDVRITGKSWHKLKRGLKTDDLKIRLIPAIDAIIERGKYHGREPVGERSDGVVAFHYFDGFVDVSGEAVQVGVTVGEDAFGNLFYNLNHDADRLWQKKRARLLPRLEARGGEPSPGAPEGDPAFSLASGVGVVNIAILRRSAGFLDFFADLDGLGSDGFLGALPSRRYRAAEARPVFEKAAVERMARDLARQMGLAVPVEVRATEATLPESVRRSARKQGMEGGIEAAYLDGVIYIVSERMRSEAQIEEALLHEGFGHYGLRRTFAGRLRAEASRLYLAMGGLEGARALAERHGVGEKMAPYFERAEGLSAYEQAFYLVDELVAHLHGETMGESLPRRIWRAIQAYIGAVRAWLREKGLIRLAALGDTELMHLMARTKKAARQAGGAQGGGGAVLMAGRREDAGDSSVLDDAGADVKALLSKEIPSGESGGKQPAGISVEQAQALADEFLAAYNGNVPLTARVADTQEEIYGPAATIENVGRIKGAYHGKSGIFTLAASNLHNLRDGRATLRHEILGHFGLNTFDPADKRALLEKVLTTDGGPLLRREWAEVRKKYGDKSGLEQAEELFALVAEQPDSVLDWLLDVVGALLARSLRGLGLLDAETSRSELRQVVRDIARGIRAGELQQQTFPESDDAQFSLGAMESTLKATRESLYDRAKQWLADKLETHYGALLGALTFRQLAELAGNRLPHIQGMVEAMTRMQTARNQMADQSARLAERWQHLGRKKAQMLADMMHAATLAGVDPAEEYVSVLDVKEARERIRQIERLKKSNPNEHGAMLRQWNQELKELRGRLGLEQRRAAAYPGLVRQWQALPADAQAIYREARDDYVETSKRMEAAIIARIEAAELADNVKQAAKYQVRREFEAARVEAPYFPLQRHGKFYTVAAREGADGKKEHAFFMFDDVGARRRARAEIEAEGWAIVKQGRQSEMAKELDGISEQFVVDAVANLRQQLPDVLGDRASDVVYQTFLQAMPYLSNRVHFIHRKKTPGFSGDALRAFAFNMAHQASQVARMEAQPAFSRLLGYMDQYIKESAKETPDHDVTKLEALAEEARKRHEWLMNPKGNKYTAWATTAGFVWYLGASPAAALVNLSQTAIVAFPDLAAKYGVAKAAKALLRSMSETIAARRRWQERGDYARWGGLSADEQAAMKGWHDAGVIDVTQSHMLMGLAETDSAGYNPTVARALELTGSMFHEAEVVNREATLLAAYRLAREAGKSHDAARHGAQDVAWDTHFDYGNANRARWMQGDVAKVLLLFRSYSQHMSWFLWRNFYQGIKGESPEVRAEARKRFMGVLGMTGVFAGAMGMPLMSVMFAVANAAAALFGDDDEPWDAETEFRNWLAQFGLLGRVADRGLINAATGADVSSRVTLDGLWWRGPDKELSGRDLFSHYLEQLAGPVVGLAGKPFQAYDLLEEGKIDRALDTLVPKAIRDGLRAMRYTGEGVQSLRGDPVVPRDAMTPMDLAWQTMGFTPDKVRARWDANSALKNAETRITDRRRDLVAAYALAQMDGDTATMREALREISGWNRKHPALAINMDTLRRSIMQRRRYSREMEGGVYVSPKLRYLRGEAAVAEY